MKQNGERARKMIIVPEDRVAHILGSSPPSSNALVKNIENQNATETNSVQAHGDINIPIGL